MSGFDVKLTITGLQEAQREVLQVQADLKPDGAIGAVVKYVTAGLHRYAVAYTHVLTGSLRAAQHLEVSGLTGEVFIDPAATNPMTGRQPSEYGVYEFGRGGEHDAYERAVEHADDLIDAAVSKYFK